MDLNNIKLIKRLDPQGMLDIVYKWPDFIEDALNTNIKIPQQIQMQNQLINYQNKVRNILICGMGGSAVSGDYLTTFLENKIDIPILVRRNYSIPEFVDKQTLTILISYSGNTEETISCLIEALQKNTMIVGIASGGKLLEFFSKNNLPYFKIPGGMQPRASFPLLLFPLLKILGDFDIYNLDNNVIKEILNNIKVIREECKLDIPSSDNPAKTIAKSLYKKIPVIWSPYKCVGNRIKCQINENSKMQAFSEEIPEFNHNHIVGWESYSEENPFIIFILRFPSEHPNVSLRFEISKEMIRNKVEIVEMNVKGSELLNQLIYATYMGDYISIYLSILNNVDPNTVQSIDYLKHELELRKQTQSSVFRNLDKIT